VFKTVSIHFFVVCLSHPIDVSGKKNTNNKSYIYIFNKPEMNYCSATPTRTIHGLWSPTPK
jgi:hypothetical protein